MVNSPDVSPHETCRHILSVEDCDGVREHSLSNPKYFIGRDIANDICLNSEFASRYHALLLRVPTPQQGEYRYRILDGDLEGKPSTNGLTVNGERISAHQLNEGDVIAFGPDAKAVYRILYGTS